MSNKQLKITVLYIDDEVNNLTAFRANFRRVFQVLTAESALQAKEILKAQEVHVIISDQRMPQMTGIAFFEDIKDDYPDPIRILLTGYADIQAVIDAINKGQIYKYFSKPWDEGKMRAAIEEAYNIQKLRKEQEVLTEKLKDVNKKLEFIARQKLLS